MPEDKTVPLRRRDFLTDRKTDFAIASADFFLNTPRSRSRALLVDCTRDTQRRLLFILSKASRNQIACQQGLDLPWVSVLTGRLRR